MEIPITAVETRQLKLRQFKFWQLFILMENFTYISNMLCFKRLKTCKSILYKISDSQELKNCARNEFFVWYSDEAHFLLPGHVNSKNNIFWGSTSPEHCLHRSLLSKVYSLGCHFQTWHHWRILVQIGERERALCDNQHWSICSGAS